MKLNIQLLSSDPIEFKPIFRYLHGQDQTQNDFYNCDVYLGEVIDGFRSSASHDKSLNVGLFTGTITFYD